MEKNRKYKKRNEISLDEMEDIIEKSFLKKGVGQQISFMANNGLTMSRIGNEHNRRTFLYFLPIIKKEHFSYLKAILQNPKKVSKNVWRCDLGSILIQEDGYLFTKIDQRNYKKKELSSSF